MKINLTLFFCLPFCIGLLISQNIIYVNISATGLNNGSSWVNAYKNLQAAIDASKKDDVLWVAKGIYKPGNGSGNVTLTFIPKSNITIYGGFSGTETMLSQRNFKLNETILSGDHAGDDDPLNNTLKRTDNARHVMVADTSVKNLVLDGIIISNGHTLGGSAAGDDRRGGGFLCYGQVKIYNCIFRNNYAYFGAAFYPRFDVSAYILDNCTFINNTADVGGGGAMYVVSPSGIITNCTFENNTSGGSGGALNVQLSTPAFRNCKFINNATTGPLSYGGAAFFTIPGSYFNNCEFIGNKAATTGGALTINGNVATSTLDTCLFMNNTSPSGGAISLYNSSTLTTSAQKIIFNKCHFENNSSTNSGGACLSGFKSINTYNNCFFKNNKANFGGALSIQNDSTSVNINSTKFDSNVANRTGGAIYGVEGIKLILDKTEFTANKALIGGALGMVEDTINVVGSLQLTNSRITRNEASDLGGGIFTHNMSSTLNNCLIVDNICETGTGTGGGIAINQQKNIGMLIKLVNSTLAGNRAKIGSGISSLTTVVNLLRIELLNSILSNTGSNYATEAGPMVIFSLGGNLSSDNSFPMGSTYDVVNTNPLFEDPMNSDYHLKTGSPCINKGIKTADVLALDIENRIRDNNPDKGCYEFNGIISTNDPESEHLLSVISTDQSNQILFEIESPWLGRFQVYVVDAGGRIILSRHLNKWMDKQKLFLDESLTAGLYYLNVKLGSTNISKAFIKSF